MQGMDRPSSTGESFLDAASQQESVAGDTWQGNRDWHTGGTANGLLAAVQTSGGRLTESQANASLICGDGTRWSARKVEPRPPVRRNTYAVQRRAHSEHTGTTRPSGEPSRDVTQRAEATRAGMATAEYL